MYLQAVALCVGQLLASLQLPHQDPILFVCSPTPGYGDCWLIALLEEFVALAPGVAQARLDDVTPNPGLTLLVDIIPAPKKLEASSRTRARKQLASTARKSPQSRSSDTEPEPPPKKSKTVDMIKRPQSSLR